MKEKLVVGRNKHKRKMEGRVRRNEERMKIGSRWKIERGEEERWYKRKKK